MQAAIPRRRTSPRSPPTSGNSTGQSRGVPRLARNCLTARRLIERGVRMVQVWNGDGVSWEAHDDITGKG